MGSKHRLTLFGLYVAEGLNFLVHTSNYSMANPVGSGDFLVDIWGLPPHPLIENLTVGTLINSVLGLAAVMVPVVMWRLFLEQQKLINEPDQLFGKRVHRIIAGLIILLYSFVVATEFSVLYLRIIEEVNVGPIPIASGETTGFIPMLIMSIALILANLGLGLYVAYTHRIISQMDF